MNTTTADASLSPVDNSALIRGASAGNLTARVFVAVTERPERHARGRVVVVLLLVVVGRVAAVAALVAKIVGGGVVIRPSRLVLKTKPNQRPTTDVDR
jgi:hypothetical protein